MSLTAHILQLSTAALCVISSSHCLKIAGLTPFVLAVSLGVAGLKQDKG